MLELVFLIIKSVVLVPVMLIAALVNSALCSIGLSFACQDLSYNLDILRSSAIVVGILVVAAPTLYFLITQPDRVAGRIERFIVRFPHQVVHFLAWLHYVFVPHPAEGPEGAALWLQSCHEDR